LPEVAGNAALLVDPYSTAAIAAGIARLDQDVGLRERLSEAGPRQAACFSQAAYLDRLEAMYTAVLAGAPRLYKPIGIPGVK
jgi:glycosyltransferase involved in cell wall biosynthesis